MVHSPGMVPLKSAQSFWGLETNYEICDTLKINCNTQTQIMKEYPAELTVVFFYNLIVSLLAAIVGAFTEPDSSVWRIKPDIALASILCSVSTQM